MGRAPAIAALLALSACFTEPSYEGRFCDATESCPDGLSCVEDRCVLLVADEDAGGVRDATTNPDGGEDDPSDATANNRDATANEPDASTNNRDATTHPDGGARVCQEGETRSCYSGQAGTQGVGICRAGTETCVNNSFGPCAGQILPRAETCNSIDDDCDRVADNFCPTGAVDFVNSFDTALTGWLPFGDNWAGQGCAAGDVVTGFFGHYGEFLNEVGEHCDTPQIAINTGVTPHTYSLILTPAPSAVPRGGAMGANFNSACAPGTMVVEISGLSGSYIDQLSFTCAEFELIDHTGPNNSRTFAIREVPGTRSYVPLEAGGPGGVPFDLPCPTHSASSVRLHGALGSISSNPLFVTTLGLGCSEMAVPLR